MGLSPHRGPGMEVCLPGTSRDNKRGLWKWSVSLYGNSMRRTWTEGSFTPVPEGYIKEGSGDILCACEALALLRHM